VALGRRLEKAAEKENCALRVLISEGTWGRGLERVRGHRLKRKKWKKVVGEKNGDKRGVIPDEIPTE